MQIDLIIAKIIKEKIPCFFISPHLDDAVFSAGGLLLRLASKTKVTIVSVFTEASESPYTLSAGSYLRKSGRYKSALDLFSARRLEDAAVCKELGVNFEHLGLSDALFRKKKNNFFKEKYFNKFVPELNHVYPTYRWHIALGKIAQSDSDTVAEIENKFRLIEKRIEYGYVFCPYGIGGHIDHIITRKMCEKVFPDLIFWSDFPYNIRIKEKKGADSEFDPGIFDISDIRNEKIRIMSFYKSQIKSIFPGISELPPEVYYITKKING